MVQAEPSRYKKVLEDEETALLDEEDGEEASIAAGRISADVRWQTWPRRGRCSAVTGIAVLQSAYLQSEASLCLVQDLSEDELGKVFKSGLHLPEWAMLRLVSKRWKARADSCADCVNVGLTDAEWPDQRLKEYKWNSWELDPCVAQAAFSRLCYVL